MTTTERTGGLHVELYVRETLPAPAARQRGRLTERLRGLAGEDRIDGFDVFDCPKRIRCEDTDETAARDRYLAASRWARDSGVGLRPFFETRECYGMDTGERGDWLVFPALSLAVFDDGDLAAVYPHAEGDDYRSVTDGLRALANAEVGDSADEEEVTDESEHAYLPTAD